MSKIVIVSINYANEDEVIKYAENLSLQSNKEDIAYVVVVNRLSLNITESYLKENLKKIPIKSFIYNPGNNLGYLNGCIYGYQKFKIENPSNVSWVFITNTDIEIPDTNFFKKVINSKYPVDVWSIGPSVFSVKNKSYDNPQYKERISLGKINRNIFIYKYPLFAIIHSGLATMKGKFGRKIKENSQYVYTLHGCFFGIKPEFADILINESYDGFLYSEEAYIAEKVRRASRKAFYDSNIEVNHNESSVTGLLGISKKAKYISNSLIYIKNKFY